MPCCACGLTAGTGRCDITPAPKGVRGVRGVNRLTQSTPAASAPRDQAAVPAHATQTLNDLEAGNDPRARCLLPGASARSLAPAIVGASDVCKF